MSPVQGILEEICLQQAEQDMQKKCILFEHFTFYCKVYRCSVRTWCKLIKILKEVQMNITISCTIKFKMRKTKLH